MNAFETTARIAKPAYPTIYDTLSGFEFYVYLSEDMRNGPYRTYLEAYDVLRELWQ